MGSCQIYGLVSNTHTMYVVIDVVIFTCQLNNEEKMLFNGC